MKNRFTTAFTIVELLIVVVIVAILAGITVLAYDTIFGNSEAAAAKSDLKTLSSELQLERMDSGVYPPNLGAIGVDTETDAYTLDYRSTNNSYCLAAYLAGDSERSFYISSESGTVGEGTCDD